jgi:MASE6
MKKNVSDIIWNIAACRLSRDHEPETLRKVLVLNLLFSFGIIFLFILGTIALVQNNMVLFLADFILGMTITSSLFWLRKTQNPKHVAFFGVFIAFCYFLFLVAYGGENGSAFVWSFVFPLMSIFLLGGLIGFVASTIFLILTIVIFILGHQVSSFLFYSTDLIIRFISAFCMVTLLAVIMEQARVLVQRKLLNANLKLKKSLKEVKTLTGLLPICANCKDIRDDKGYWSQLEEYVQQHSDAQFSHGICPQCSDKLYGDQEWYIQMKKEDQSSKLP